jgi:putative acetyltransferase
MHLKSEKEQKPVFDSAAIVCRQQSCYSLLYMPVKIFEVQNITLLLTEQLLKIWESSVRATHLFLSDSEIENIKTSIPEALNAVDHLIIALNEDASPSAFMGIEQQKLEMLFIADQERGKGLGKKLIKYGIKHYAINEVTVNEQNSLAKGFYEYMGFHIYKRCENDEQGNPYPLLYMKLD